MDVKPLVFTVPGEPVVKQRPRFGRGRRVFTPQKTLDAEARLGAYGAQAVEEHGEWPLAAIFELRLTFYCSSRKQCDLDNFIKLVDGLNGITWYDDHLVDRIVAERRFDRQNPRTEVELRVLSLLPPTQAAAKKAAHERKVERRSARKSRRDSGGRKTKKAR